MVDWKTGNSITNVSIIESKLELGLLLSEIPADPLKYNSPDVVTLDLLKQKYNID